MSTSRSFTTREQFYQTLDHASVLLDLSKMESASISLSSPSNSNQYLFGAHDQYAEAGYSESHSSYDMAFSRDLTGTNAFPSPESREADDGCDSSLETNASGETVAKAKTSVKRKRENRYKNAPPSVISRRRAQNRASQRAYRERKDQRIKDLEQMLEDTRTRNEILSHAYAELQAEHVKLKHVSPSSTTHHDAHHSHSHSHELASSMLGAYTSMPESSVSADPSGAFVDVTSLAILSAGDDLESYLYPDIEGYPL